MLVMLSLAWGLTWPAMKIALSGIPPFSMRVASIAVGTVALYVLAKLQGTSLRVKGRLAWLHIFVISLLNIVLFSTCTVFAQLFAATGRVAMLVYTMPIWASLMAWIILGERFTRAGVLALALCTTGTAILVYPLAQAGVPTGILLALGGSLCWAAGTVYMKWADLHVDPMTIAIWQLVIGFVLLGACVPIFQNSIDLLDAPPRALVAMVFSGLLGSGIAYFLWYNIIRMVPAMTASLGVLSSPVIGVISSAIVLGERPTPADIIGYVLIFAASASVLLQRQAPSVTPDSP
ncbi:MAG: DMT family transporter [Xanthobacteraceae bacterium]|nr:DMT family transporter [Xanthobacteraceae bacterium]